MEGAAGNEYALPSFCRSSIFRRTANSVLTVCVSPTGASAITPDPSACGGLLDQAAQYQKMYFSANWINLGATLSLVMIPKVAGVDVAVPGLLNCG
jgi:hypothetical protein